jgi:hypothetical protein
MTKSRKWPPGIFLAGCVTALIANFLAGALGHRWIFYVGLLAALSLIAVGSREIFRRMDRSYMDGLDRLRSSSTKTKGDHNGSKP